MVLLSTSFDLFLQFFILSRENKINLSGELYINDNLQPCTGLERTAVGCFTVGENTMPPKNEEVTTG